MFTDETKAKTNKTTEPMTDEEAREVKVVLDSDYSVLDTAFMDAFEAIHTAPEDLPATRLDYGFIARVRDGHRIRADFRRVIQELGLRDEPTAP